MCKNKIIIKNKRYQPTKKNGYTKETPRDRRLSYIEIPCGECKECKKTDIVTGKQIGRAHV